jgi:hypothetical protein
MENEPLFNYKEPFTLNDEIEVPIFNEVGDETGIQTIGYEYYREGDMVYITYIDNYGDAHPDDVNMMLWHELGRYQII